MSERTPSTFRTWDPFHELDRLTSGLWPRLTSSELRPAERSASFWSPSIDISENESHYVVTVELAGAKRDDVQVEVHDGILTIKGEKRSEREEKKEERRYVERCFGRFSRSLQLPKGADPDAVVARFEEGVLTVEIAKTTVADQPKAIQVQ
jgi:HSP20 family protein